MAQVLANRDLAFLHPVARAVGGPAVRNMATVGGNLFAPSPYGDFTAALLALDATVAMHGGYSGRETPLEEFLARAIAAGAGLSRSVTFSGRRTGCLPLPQGLAREAEGRRGLSIAAICRLPADASAACVSPTRDGADADAPKAAERALEGRGPR